MTYDPSIIQPIAHVINDTVKSIQADLASLSSTHLVQTTDVVEYLHPPGEDDEELPEGTLQDIVAGLRVQEVEDDDDDDEPVIITANEALQAARLVREWNLQEQARQAERLQIRLGTESAVQLPIPVIIDQLTEHLKRLEVAVTKSKTNRPNKKIDAYFSRISPPKPSSRKNHEFPPLNPPLFEDLEPTSRDEYREHDQAITPYNNHHEWRVQAEHDSFSNYAKKIRAPLEPTPSEEAASNQESGADDDDSDENGDRPEKEDSVDQDHDDEMGDDDD
jgi:hypothetical protein